MNPTKFPALHIAESVVNRILNLRDELQTLAPATISMPQAPQSPETPETQLLGQEIDSEVAQPTPMMEAAPDDNGLLPGIVGGDNLINSVIQ